MEWFRTFTKYLNTNQLKEVAFNHVLPNAVMFSKKFQVKQNKTKNLIQKLK